MRLVTSEETAPGTPPTAGLQTPVHGTEPCWPVPCREDGRCQPFQRIATGVTVRGRGAMRCRDVGEKAIDGRQNRRRHGPDKGARSHSQAYGQALVRGNTEEAAIP